MEAGPAISDSNGLGNHGYCRNPDDAHSKPYCHPMDTPGETEECNIEECAPDENADKYQNEAAEVKTYVSARDCECASSTATRRPRRTPPSRAS